MTFAFIFSTIVLNHQGMHPHHKRNLMHNWVIEEETLLFNLFLLSY